MPRDYKNRRRSAKTKPTPGWIWGLGGLGLGLAVALAVHLQDRRIVRPSEPVANQAAIPSSARDDSESSDEPVSGSGFDFYDMLTKFEVVIPETETPVAAATKRQKSDHSDAGTYVLQAGSFRNFPDADRMKAQLALLGLESTVQAVTVDDRRWHRVRLGPYSNMTDAQIVRRQIRQANIDVLLLRVGD